MTKYLIVVFDKSHTVIVKIIQPNIIVGSLAVHYNIEFRV